MERCEILACVKKTIRKREVEEKAEKCKRWKRGGVVAVCGEGLWQRKKGEQLTKVTLLILYGLFDSEKHGGKPLIQPRDGIKFFYL